MIDNNIHQIWVGDKRIPNHVKNYMDRVKNHHTDFNYYFWNDDNLPELPENLKKIYDSYQEPVLKADLLRMYVVYTYGGTYLDADLIPARGLDSHVILHKEYDGFIVYDDSYQMSALSNTIFGFKKNHLLLKYMLDNITHEGQWIGPNWWAQIICKYLQLDNDVATVNDLRDKLVEINLQVVLWKDIQDNCFTHEALATWIEGSIWNKKLKTGDYD
jgi:mannosyltransferase OCH1-like enzyme